jgi:hypothetical protein
MKKCSFIIINIFFLIAFAVAQDKPVFISQKQFALKHVVFSSEDSLLLSIDFQILSLWNVFSARLLKTIEVENYWSASRKYNYSSTKLSAEGKYIATIDGQFFLKI